MKGLWKRVAMMRSGMGRDLRGREVSAGVYFYNLKAGGFEKTNRMTLVK